MASLTAHLRQLEDHGRLPFHSQCPLWRSERLPGVLSNEGLVSQRTQAAVVAAVLAASAAAPAAVSAQEPDQQTEGAVAPESVSSDDPAENPDSTAAGSGPICPSTHRQNRKRDGAGAWR
jgi:hypothetical protein